MGQTRIPPTKHLNVRVIVQICIDPICINLLDLLSQSSSAISLGFVEGSHRSARSRWTPEVLHALQLPGHGEVDPSASQDGQQLNAKLLKMVSSSSGNLKQKKQEMVVEWWLNGG